MYHFSYEFDMQINYLFLNQCKAKWIAFLCELSKEHPKTKACFASKCRKGSCIWAIKTSLSFKKFLASQTWNGNLFTLVGPITAVLTNLRKRKWEASLDIFLEWGEELMYFNGTIFQWHLKWMFKLQPSWQN